MRLSGQDCKVGCVPPAQILHGISIPDPEEGSSELFIRTIQKIHFGSKPGVSN